MRLKVGSRKVSFYSNMYSLILLFLPVALISMTSFYTISTPDAVWYKYRNFEFSFLVIPVILLAFLHRKKTKAIRFDYVICAIAIKDAILAATGRLNPDIPFDFSLYFLLIIAWAISVEVLRYENKQKLCERFLDIYFIIAFLSMLIRILLKMSTDGRYGAIGLSVGGTGFFAAVYILYLIYIHEYNRKTIVLLVIAFITLFFSGQRTNLLFCVIFCAPFALKNLISKTRKKGSRIKAVFLWGALLLGIIFVGAILLLNEIGIEIPGMGFVSRVIDAIERFASGDLKSEASVEGRFLSIEAGLKILQENPLGISNVFYDLQLRMTRLNYPTYPHSALLDCSLLWSTPITFFCELWMLRLLKKLIKKRDNMFWIVLFIQVLMIVWGSPFLDYPLLFIILILLSVANESIKNTTFR